MPGRQNDGPTQLPASARSRKRRVTPAPANPGSAASHAASGRAAQSRPASSHTKKRRVAPVAVQAGAGSVSAASQATSGGGGAAHSRSASSASPGAVDTARNAMLLRMQNTLTRQMGSLQSVFESTLPLNKHGHPKAHTAHQVHDNLRHLGTELSSFARACGTLKQTVKKLQSHDAEQQAKEDQRLSSIRPLQVKEGEHKGKWYCSEADDDLVCRCGPNHGGRFGFAPSHEKKKVTRHINTQHIPRKAKDGYNSLDWVV